MGVLLQLLGTLALAQAQELPVALAPPDAACHATVDQAAIAAITVAMALPPDVEHGGAIYDRGGCFVFSAPVTNFKPMAVVFRVRSSGSSKLAGIYHTHTLANGPCDEFSSDDVLQALQSRVPSFIGVHGPNHIRKLSGSQLPQGPLTLAERNLMKSGSIRGSVLAELPPPAMLVRS